MSALSAPEIVAHRGAGRDFIPPVELSGNRPAAPPENTLPAFAWGWRHGTTCELDLHLTSDDRLIVIHDKTTGRTCDRNLTVADTPLEELEGLDAGIKKGALWAGLRLPTLEEVFDVMPDDRRLYVELKTGPGINEPLVEALRTAGRGPKEVVFISSNIDSIGRLKQRLPDYTCYLIVAFGRGSTDGTWKAGYKTADPSDPRRLSHRRAMIASGRPGDHSELDRALIELVRQPVAGDSVVPLDGLDVSWHQPESFAPAMRSAGVEWGCWTVDSCDTAVLMRSRGAAQITSNCPEDLRLALAYADGEL